MKKIYTALFFLFFYGNSQAQINLEHTYPVSTEVRRVQFGYAGVKYVAIDYYTNHTIQIYSTTHVLEKTIPIPMSILNELSAIFYVSDDLFDLDSTIEYIAGTTPGGLQQDLYVMKEDSTVILYRNNAYLVSNDLNLISEFSNVFPTPTGTKLLISTANGNEVYALPGNLPCSECSNGEFSSNILEPVENENRSSLSNPYPNPTNNQTRIDYQLPQGVQQGELIFYNATGNEVKRFKVTNMFNFIYVSAQNLPSGTYYYTLQTSVGVSEGKKMVVIR